MKESKILLAAFLALVITMGIACATPLTVNPGDFAKKNLTLPEKPIPLAHSIRVLVIDYGSAAPGNSEPVTITVSVTNPFNRNGIGGLDKSNFKIEVPTHGFNYTAIAIKKVDKEWIPRISGWNYKIQIAPGVFQGHQYKWKNSPGRFNLYYFIKENQMAVTTFDLKMYASYP
jgi:hypothetical protein